MPLTFTVANGDGIAGNPTLQIVNSSNTFKGTARVASTANITTLSGLLTIDGVTVSSADRVLVKNQTTQSQNGLYKAQSGA